MSGSCPQPLTAKKSAVNQAGSLAKEVINKHVTCVCACVCLQTSFAVDGERHDSNGEKGVSGQKGEEVMMKMIIYSDRK